jgi:hypothetical protein
LQDWKVNFHTWKIAVLALANAASVHHLAHDVIVGTGLDFENERTISH